MTKPAFEKLLSAPLEFYCRNLSFYSTLLHSIFFFTLSFIASSFRVTEENLVFETVPSGPYSSFECFLCS